MNKYLIYLNDNYFKEINYIKLNSKINKQNEGHYTIKQTDIFKKDIIGKNGK